MANDVNTKLREIQVLQDEVDKRLKSLRSEAIAEIQNMVDRFEIYSCEIRFKETPVIPRRRSSAGTKVPMKYRGPKGELWSGRGRLPMWVREIEKNGESRNDYLIQY